MLLKNIIADSDDEEDPSKGNKNERIPQEI